MTPFQFGDSNAPLVGVYHAPQVMAKHRPAVLLCNPFGEEAIRAFRLFRLLANRLADLGCPVLRFDYPATGDSAGACEEARLGKMTDAIHDAHEELLAMSAATRVVWVGLRLGAALAIRAAAMKPARLSGLFLWEPVVSGADYLEELAAAHAGAVGHFADPDDRTITQALGFALTPALCSDFTDLDLTKDADDVSGRIVIMSDDPVRDRRLAEALEAGGARLDCIDDPDGGGWNSDAAMNDYVIPVRSLEIIAQRIENWR